MIGEVNPSASSGFSGGGDTVGVTMVTEITFGADCEVGGAREVESADLGHSFANGRL